MDKNNLEKRNLDEEIENELERLENDEDDMEIIDNTIDNENKDSQQNIININEIKEYIKELEMKKNKNLQSNELVNNLTKANTYILSLKQELSFLLNKMVNIYSDIFPQLSSLITIPLFYIKTIKVIEEKEIFRKKGIQDIKDDLSFLPSNIYLSLSLVLNNAKERMEYRENDINITEKIKSIYSQYLDLNNILEQIQNFINKNMPKIAPNLTELVGSDIASKLISQAGSLKKLIKIPSSSILNMGKNNSNLNIENHNKINNGFLTELPEYKKESDNKLKMKILRKYANKIALSARMDFEKVKKNGDYGKEIKNEIKEKIDKIINNVEPVIHKPLPRPDEKPRKKRGGKNARRLKKIFEITEIRKKQNRIQFGVPEKEFRDTGIGFGMLDQSNLERNLKYISQFNKIYTKKQKELNEKIMEYEKKEQMLQRKVSRENNNDDD